VAASKLHNEKELLFLTSHGDEKAFATLFHHYADNIFGIAMAYTKSNEMAEELVQDVFLKIWLKKEMLSTISRFDDYLFVAVRNLLLNYLRQKKREQKFIDHLTRHFEEANISPELQFQFKESQELIEKAVSQLPAQQQTAYRLSRNYGLQLNEVAEKMHLSRNTVRNHLAKALESIREYLKNNSGGAICFTALMMTCR
jgi:RNA polymerase sigma-70 factor (family 1)